MNEASGEADQQSILALLAELVDVPSRAASDDPASVLDRLRAWLLDRNLPCHELRDEEGRVVGLTGISGDQESGRPAYFLNAPADTAGYGDPGSWHSPPETAVIRNGRLYGRGSGDCKAGIAIFCHLFDHYHRNGGDRPCALGYVFDAEEHSGRFTGMRRFLDTCPAPIAGVMIGYPGIERIVTGARGFWRATVRVHGRSGHSGSSHHPGVNAVERASLLIGRLAGRARSLGALAADGFPLPPRLTVTRIEGGGEFSLVPDLCEVDVDVRLTPAFVASDADALVRADAAAIDAASPGGAPTELVLHQTYPAYLLSEESALIEALRGAAEEIIGERLPIGPCGPSNVGNLLATRGIEALCGFGVRAGGLHGVDEWIDLETIGPVAQVYREALARLLREPLGEERWRRTASTRKSFA